MWRLWSTSIHHIEQKIHVYDEIAQWPVQHICRILVTLKYSNTNSKNYKSTAIAHQTIQYTVRTREWVVVEVELGQPLQPTDWLGNRACSWCVVWVVWVCKYNHEWSAMLVLAELLLYQYNKWTKQKSENATMTFKGISGWLYSSQQTRNIPPYYTFHIIHTNNTTYL